MLQLLPISRLMFLILCNLFKPSISLVPARTIKGSQPPIRVLHGKFRPTGLPMPVRSARPTTAVYASTGTGTDDISSMRAGEMKKELESYGISTVSFVEKSELVKALEKARAEGLTPESPSTSKTKKKKKRRSSSSSSIDEDEDDTTKPREERLADELENCRAMKAGEMRKELEGLGISTKSFFEKTDFVTALADARVDGVGKKAEEGYAEYSNVEVLTDDASGPRPPSSQQQQQPEGGGGGGASPFGGGGGMGGMGGMGGIADMLKNGAGGGGAGMGDAMGKAQELMKNPKIMELMMKAQGNPKIMAAMQECMSNPAAFAKYQNDPEVSELIKELQKAM
mmetsp:Transcript_35993/g.40165  ORF Transcript_35993/g.40165 Transcript_35993/m.40165 type:complete len:340 (+) Transcript_35993:67-1086(+)